MNTLHLRDAKATLSALVEAAERGEATMVTKHGRPAAMIVPVADGRRLYQEAKPSLVSLLMAMPGGLDLERDDRPYAPPDL